MRPPSAAVSVAPLLTATAPGVAVDADSKTGGGGCHETLPDRMPALVEDDPILIIEIDLSVGIEVSSDDTWIDAPDVVEYGRCGARLEEIDRVTTAHIEIRPVEYRLGGRLCNSERCAARGRAGRAILDERPCRRRATSGKTRCGKGWRRGGGRVGEECENIRRPNFRGARAGGSLSSRARRANSANPQFPSQGHGFLRWHPGLAGQPTRGSLPGSDAAHKKMDPVSTTGSIFSCRPQGWRGVASARKRQSRFPIREDRTPG